MTWTVWDNQDWKYCGISTKAFQEFPIISTFVNTLTLRSISRNAVAAAVSPMLGANGNWYLIGMGSDLNKVTDAVAQQTIVGRWK